MPTQDLEQITTDISDALWNGTLADRQETADQLMAYLTSAPGQDLARSNSAQYDQLIKQWVLLSFSAFTILPQDEQQDLLKTRLLVAIQAGYKAEDFTQAFFDMYETDEFLAPMFTGFAALLQQNTETLGATSLDVGGTKYLPQVRYWLLDYAKFPSQSARRNSIDRLNYVNTSPNGRQLTQVQRNQLLEILKLNDALNSVDRPAEPAPRVQQPAPQPVPQPKPQSAAPQPQSKPVVPTPPPAPVQQPPPMPKPPVPAPVPPPRPPQPVPVSPVSIPQNPQKDLPRGLPVYEKDLPPPRPQPPVQAPPLAPAPVAPPAPPVPLMPTIDIDQKLRDLASRAGKEPT